ncbi:MAG: phage tail tube protein [Planctomycetia bacterium]|nr:phage tail tube protein [Planctomycetia bacterium]
MPEQEQIAMLGMECVLSIGGAEVKNVQDVTVTLSAGEADITTRGNRGWRQTVPTLRECTIEFTMLYLPGDTTFDTLHEAFESGDTVAVSVEGISGQFGVTNFSYEQPLEDAVKVNVTLKLAKIDSATGE